MLLPIRTGASSSKPNNNCLSDVIAIALEQWYGKTEQTVHHARRGRLEKKIRVQVVKVTS